MIDRNFGSGGMMKNLVLAALVASSLMAGVSANAVELVKNGGFETSTGYGQLTNNVTVSDWTVPSGGYSFLFNASNVITGANGQYGALSLWGVGNGGPDAIVASPDGGNFIAQDSAFQVQPLQQTISGLTAGQSVVVSFYWAAAQQTGFDGATTDNWNVSLGSETHSTSVINLGNHEFSGWRKESFTFTATSATETLSFLAAGGPPGLPPFALLDGVSVSAGVPELSTWAMLLAGFGGLGVAARLRRRAAVAA
jgi:hypothetical protein